MPAAILLFEWFQQRRGMASGIMYAGTGAGGTVFPFIVQALLRAFGYKAAMISLVRRKPSVHKMTATDKHHAVSRVLGSLQLAPLPLFRSSHEYRPDGRGPHRALSTPQPDLIRDRKSIGASSVATRSMPSEAASCCLRWETSFPLSGYQVSFVCPLNSLLAKHKQANSLCGGLGNSAARRYHSACDLERLVATHAPSRAWNAIRSDRVGSLAASVPGLLLLGYLTDHWPLRLVITLSCLGSAAACLLLWGFSTNAGVLIAFVVIFGLLGPSFSAIWAKLIGIVASQSLVNVVHRARRS